MAKDIEIYNEDIRAESQQRVRDARDYYQAIRGEEDARMARLDMLIAHADDLKASAMKDLMESISTEKSWRGNQRPVVAEDESEF